MSQTDNIAFSNANQDQQMSSPQQVSNLTHTSDQIPATSQSEKDAGVLVNIFEEENSQYENQDWELMQFDYEKLYKDPKEVKCEEFVEKVLDTAEFVEPFSCSNQLNFKSESVRMQSYWRRRNGFLATMIASGVRLHHQPKSMNRIFQLLGFRNISATLFERGALPRVMTTVDQWVSQQNVRKLPASLEDPNSNFFGKIIQAPLFQRIISLHALAEQNIVSKTNHIVKKGKKGEISLHIPLDLFERSVEVQKWVDKMIQIKKDIKSITEEIQMVKNLPQYSKRLLSNATDKLFTFQKYRFDEVLRERISTEFRNGLRVTSCFEPAFEKFKYHTSLPGYEEIFKINPFANYAVEEGRKYGVWSFGRIENEFNDIICHLNAVQKLYTMVTKTNFIGRCTYFERQMREFLNKKGWPTQQEMKEVYQNYFYDLAQIFEPYCDQENTFEQAFSQDILVGPQNQRKEDAQMVEIHTIVPEFQTNGRNEVTQPLSKIDSNTPCPESILCKRTHNQRFEMLAQDNHGTVAMTNDMACDQLTLNKSGVVVSVKRIKL